MLNKVDVLEVCDFVEFVWFELEVCGFCVFEIFMVLYEGLWLFMFVFGELVEKYCVEVVVEMLLEWVVICLCGFKKEFIIWVEGGIYGNVY